MKKLYLLVTLGMFGLGAAQYQPNDGYVNDGWYDSYQDGSYFPDEYYYDYPTDYYGNDYYQSMYGDYRNSINNVNWNQFFAQSGLSRHQINLVIQLNRQFSSFNVWNSYYRNNPIRWYYDRFYALERILGSRVFIVFQNNYYRGYNPVNYYNRRWTNYYVPTYRVRPVYRNVNINIYHVNKYDFHRNSVNRFGWNEPKNYYRGNSNQGGNGFRESNHSNAPMQGNRNQGIQQGREMDRVDDRRVEQGSSRVNNNIYRNQNGSSQSTPRVVNQGRMEQNRSSQRNQDFQNRESRPAQSQIRNNNSSQNKVSQSRSVNRNSASGSSRINGMNGGRSR